MRMGFGKRDPTGAVGTRAKSRRPREGSFQVSRAVPGHRHRALRGTAPPKQSQTSSPPHSSGVCSPPTSPAPLSLSAFHSSYIPSAQTGSQFPAIPLPTSFLPPKTPLQPVPPSPQIWILLIPQDTAQIAPPPGSLPPSSAYLTLVSSLPPFPAPPPSGGPRPTTEENELLEARKHAPHLIFFPTIPDIFLTQVGVQTIPDDQAQLCSKTETSPFPGVGHPRA